MIFLGAGRIHFCKALLQVRPFMGTNEQRGLCMDSQKNNVLQQQQVGSVLPELARDFGWEAQLEVCSIFPRWQELLNTVDHEVASCSRPLKCITQVLWVEVENSTWLQQIQYYKRPILQAINTVLSRSTISDIRFVLPEKRVEEQAVTRPEVVFVPPDKEKFSAFQRQAECIADMASREALVQLWYLSHACQRTDEEHR